MIFDVLLNVLIVEVEVVDVVVCVVFFIVVGDDCFECCFFVFRIVVVVFFFLGKVFLDLLDIFVVFSWRRENCGDFEGYEFLIGGLVCVLEFFEDIVVFDGVVD